jgi:hypothetical protein
MPFSEMRTARFQLSALSMTPDLISYLERNLESPIDYRSWQRVDRRISTGFVESSINRIVGRRMGKSQQIR